MHVDVLGGGVEIDESRIVEPREAIRRQVGAYERGERRQFDLTVRFPDGFTGRAWRALGEIPYGETRSYAALAGALDTAPVAVGGACARNPVPLVVPCHRVVGSDGSLRGYPGPSGVALKRRLLDHERRIAERR